MKSAEEIADDIVGRFGMPNSDRVGFEMEIAQAIRQAQAEAREAAIEECAQRIERDIPNLVQGQIGQQIAADKIRALLGEKE